MKKFYIIWTGQIVSMLGSGLSGFGLGVWIYQQTGSATQFALTALFMMLPNLVVGPLGGLLADRFDRRKLLAISDCGQAAGTLVIAALLFSGRLEVWHIYVAVVSGGVFNCFRWPAFNAMLPSIAPKQHLMRINGLVSAGEAATMIAAPLLAGLLVAGVGLAGVLIIDVITFMIGMGLLFTIRIPKLERRIEAAAVHIGSRTRNYWRMAVNDTREGWTFLRDRGALVSLLVFFAFTNFSLGMIETVFTPLVLSVGSVRTLGATSSIAAVGMLLGSIAISMWGGPRRRMQLILGFGALQGVIAIVVGWQTSVATLMFGAFSYVFLFPIIGAACNSLWQTKVPNELQGRVGAVRMMAFNVVRPLSFFLAGTLSDHVFGPRGLVMVMGAVTVLGTIGAYAYPRIRGLEAELPDLLGDDLPAAQAA
ncbi:MAG TPA: MFS transporter [Thermoanaerobaculia bacterium]|nr:MFS transporter [Thermoanaerobaculia bacterium]